MTLSNRMHLPSNRSQGRTNQNVGITQLMKANVFFCTSFNNLPKYYCQLFLINPLTLRSDLQVTSANNIHPLSSKQVMRVLDCIR